MYLRNQKFLILGVSKSGIAVAKHLLKNSNKCYFYEELHTEKIQQTIEELVALGAVRVTAENIDDVLSIIDVVVLSPGVPINHVVTVKAKQNKKRIIGELEYGYLRFQPTLVAITGTNGKTTTATLIDHVLRESERKSYLLGNVGVPFTSRLSDLDADSIGVVEVSSFQLESVNSFCPHVSCVLNISPDHLERHYSMDNYVFLKKRIFKNQRESEYALLNYDDELVRSFAQEIKAKVLWVSLKEEVDGAYKQGDKLFYKGEAIIDEKEIALKGAHNLYNVLFAIGVCKILGEKNESITNALKTFKGVKHRIEQVCKKAGVTFFNDSKATNTASTISAIESMNSPTILILGGSEKGENYDRLFEIIKKSVVKHVVIMGASRFNMMESAGKTGYSNFTVTGDFYNAIRIAKLFSEEGDNVLLSPSCASFDNFKSYEERGEEFKRIVGEME